MTGEGTAVVRIRPDPRTPLFQLVKGGSSGGGQKLQIGYSGCLVVPGRWPFARRRAWVGGRVCVEAECRALRKGGRNAIVYKPNGRFVRFHCRRVFGLWAVGCGLWAAMRVR